MEPIAKKALLYDRYGALLTAHQREIYEEAVFHDLSLAEIAERHGVSRQGVSDLLNRTTKTMADYEEKLGLVQRFAEIETLCDTIEGAMDGQSDHNGHATGNTAVKKAVKGIRKAVR